MPELPRLRDNAPVFGMNTRDDPKNLTDGECVELVNAYPGNPPIPRKGCRHHKILDTEDFDFASHAVPFVTATGGRYAVLWIKLGTDYKLIKINLNTRILTVLGTATGLIAPAFHLIHVFDYIYSVVDEDMYWEGSTRLSRHKIIEIGDVADVVREMCINVAASVSAVTKITGTTFSDGYFSYAFTFIRHVATEAFDSDGKSQVVMAYYPGVNEGPEEIGNRKVVGGAGNFGTRIDFDLSEENYIYATEQGATHIRIYRTRKQSDVLEAQGATHFFLKDVPIPSGMSARTIVMIELGSNERQAVVMAHGFGAAATLFYDNNSALNNQVKTVVILSDDVLRLTGTGADIYPITEPGKASQDYKSVLSFDLTNEYVRVSFSAAHGFNNDETIKISGVLGGDGDANGQQYKQLQPHNVFVLFVEGHPELGGEWKNIPRIVYVQSAGWDGVNSISDTITVIDATTIEFQNKLSADFKKPFLTVYGTPIYTEEELIPTMVGGYAIRNYKDIVSFTSPVNNVVIQTITDGILAGYYGKIENVRGSTQLNGNTYKILSVSGIRITLDKSAAGVSAFVPGGSPLPTITPSLQPIDNFDTITDATLAGETAQLAVSAYSAGPLAGFCEYAATRLYLFGLLSTEKGRAYYSEFPGGDGGTPLDAAHTFPQKFLSQYNYNYYIDFSVKKGFLPTGVKRLSNDLYFFFEGEIYALFGSDPTINVPSLISEEIGCAFPDTLIIGELPVYGGQCLLYLSNLGPAITMKGGETFLFTNFKVAELWPDKNRELWDDLYNHRDHIITHCFSEFWDNTWWINYTTYAGIHRIWGHYFNPELKINQNASQGAFELKLAEV
jgi:hypothetical protein